MSGVLALRMSDFSLQNVASRLLISGHHTFSDQEMRSAVLWSMSSSDITAAVSEERMSSRVAAIAHGSVRLVVLEPSAGCGLACLCREVALTDAAGALFL